MKRYTMEQKEGWTLYRNQGGAEIGVADCPVLELLTGRAAQAGRLPIQLPADMETVEVHWEDRPLDLKAYTDEMASTYDYGFGLTY